MQDKELYNEEEMMNQEELFGNWEEDSDDDLEDEEYIEEEDEDYEEEPDEEDSDEESEETSGEIPFEDDDSDDDVMLQGARTTGLFNDSTQSGLDLDMSMFSDEEDEDDDEIMLRRGESSSEEDMIVNKNSSRVKGFSDEITDSSLLRMMPSNERNKGLGVDSDDESRMNSLLDDLSVQCGSVTFEWGMVSLQDIYVTDAIKRARKQTGIGLQQSVKEMGILVPIHVMYTEAYADWVESGNNPEDYKEKKYLLISGYRRVRAALVAGQVETNAVIWDFEDKQSGTEALLQFYLILNKVTKRKWEETYDLLKELNNTTGMSSTKKDSLLMLDQGDSMKLEDIMTSGYPEIIDLLISNKKTLQQCYQALQKKRAEEDTLAKEEQQGISEISKETKDIVGEGKKVLSDENIEDLTSNLLDELENIEDEPEELSEEDFGDLIGSDEPDPKQKVGKRHPLDPELRNAVLTRDHFTCQASGNGVDGGLPLNLALEILNVHHLVPVYLGGTDTLDNLITLDVTSHTMVHILERNSGKLNITKEKFDSLPKDKQLWFKKVLKIAKIAVDARKQQGLEIEDIKAESRASAQFQMPGSIGEKNREALKETGKYGDEIDTVKKGKKKVVKEVEEEEES